jgi:c-di-GMP-binding flagellar brake protein YcgR
VVQFERRKYPRVEAVVRVTQMGRTANLSEEGACLLTPNRFSPGAWMQLEFELPQGIVKAWAQAIWDRRARGGKGWLTGFRFTEVSPRDRKRLARFISQQIKARAARQASGSPSTSC